MLAQSLFEEGRRLMAARHYSEACPKLAESQRLDPGTGTLLNLAVCHKEEGKVGTAWIELQSVAAASLRESNQVRADAARDQLKSLEGRLPRLLLVAEAPKPGMTLTLDGTPLSAATLGVPIVVDPGVHAVRFEAPGYRPFETKAHALEGRTIQINLRLPLLTPETPETHAPAAPSTTPMLGTRDVNHPAFVPLIVTGSLASALALIGGVAWGYHELTFSRLSSNDVKEAFNIVGIASLASAIGGVSLLITAIVLPTHKVPYGTAFVPVDGGGTMTFGTAF
jgi:hypothetical protein